MERQNAKLVRSPLIELKVCKEESIWATTQKDGEPIRVPDFDISELENLFSMKCPNSEIDKRLKYRGGKLALIDFRRAYNCEIMLSKVNIPLHEIMDSVLAFDDSRLDIDQVDELIKFCPTNDEMELIKSYTGDKDYWGKCERYFFELMKVPRPEDKLRVFSYTLEFNTLISDLSADLEVLNLISEQIRSCVKLRRVMHTVLSLGNALNRGTKRGSAVGFKLHSLLELNNIHGWNKNVTLMHYLCKMIAVKQPELLDFSNELSSLEPASKLRLNFLAEDMQTLTKELERVIWEKKLCKKDGLLYKRYRKSLKKFLASAEMLVTDLAGIYCGVVKCVDDLIIYFGEEPARCPYEQVISTLLSFVTMFNQAHVENCKIIEAEKEAAQKEAVENQELKLQNQTYEESELGGVWVNVSKTD